jgi:hypothetical protein
MRFFPFAHGLADGMLTLIRAGLAWFVIGTAAARLEFAP